MLPKLIRLAQTCFGHRDYEFVENHIDNLVQKVKDSHIKHLKNVLIKVS